MTMTETPTSARSVDTFQMIDLALIYPDPENVRDELTDIDTLSASILANGLQQPLRVRLQPTGYFPDDPTCAVYVVIAGHRRLAAIQALGPLWHGDVPCMVAPEDLDTDAVTAAMLVENLQRSDLNCVEEAHAFARLQQQFEWSKADIAAKISRSETYVADRLALLKLPESIIESVRVGFYPMTAALRLKGVAHDIVEQVTKGGRVVAVEYQIETAVAEAKWKRLEKLAREKFDELVEGGLVQFDNASEWWKLAKSSKPVLDASTYTEIKKLSVDQLPKKAIGRLHLQPYARQATIEVLVPLTPSQLTKLEEKELAAREAAEQRVRARWTPEYTAWRDETDAIKAAHVDVVYAWEQAYEAAKLAFVESVNAKNAARYSMLYVAHGGTGYSSLDWDRRKAAELLGIVDGHPTTDELTNKVAAYVEQGATQLTRLVVATLLMHKQPAVLDEFTSFCRQHDIPMSAPKLPDLPAAPAQYLDGQGPEVDDTEEDYDDDEYDDA